MRKPPKTHLPADPAKRAVAAPEQSARRDIRAADASANSARRLHKPDEKKRKSRPAKSRPRRRKRVRIGEALRKIGFDEYKIAQNYADAAERLKGNPDRTGNIEKLLIDVLKECSRHIEPIIRTVDTATERSVAPGAAIHVHLMHNVPRPTRGGLIAAAASPIVLDVPSPGDALRPAEDTQAELESPLDPELALASDAS